MRPAGEDQRMRSSVDTRQRCVVLDTGELGPVVRQRGRRVRAVRDIAVAVVIGAGAIAAGGWSVATAAHGSVPADQPAPVWYATSPGGSGPAPHTGPAGR
jgi:hypothetical protein